jgi:O-antigen/teichoic acid export membrane protein
MTEIAGGDILDSGGAGRAVVRGGAIRVVGFGVGLLASVLGAALVTRHLGTATYGEYQTVVALATIVQTITDLGMTSLGLREWSQRSGAERDQFMRVLLGLRLTMTVLGIVFAVVIAVILGYSGEMVGGTAVMGLGVMIGVLGSTITVPLQAQLRMGVVTGLDVARQVATTVLLVALVIIGTTNIIPYTAMVVPANLIVVVGGFWLLRRQISMRPSFDRAAWVALIRPSISFALATAVGSLYAYAAVVLTQLVTSAHETGVFAASFRVWVIAAAIPAVLVTTAFPVLSRAARDDRHRLVYATQRLFESTALLGGAALVTCVVGAPAIIEVLAGPKFDEAIPVLRLHGIALAMTFVISTWGFSLLALHRHRALIVVNVIGLTVNATTVLILASRYGAPGGAWGTVVGETTLATGYGIALARADPLLRPRFGMVLRVLPALGLALAAGLLIGLPAVPGVVLALAIYGAGALAVGAVPDEILEHLPARLRRSRPPVSD